VQRAFIGQDTVLVLEHRKAMLSCSDTLQYLAFIHHTGTGSRSLFLRLAGGEFFRARSQPQGPYETDPIFEIAHLGETA